MGFAQKQMLFILQIPSTQRECYFQFQQINFQMQKGIYKRFTARDVITQEQALSLTNKYESPLYVYKESIILEKIRRLKDEAKQFKVCYALKANTNAQLVRLIREAGIDHVDVVSPGEIYKALACGYTPSNIMYTQNFIAPEEMDYALKVGVTLNIGALQTLQFYKDKLKGKNIFLRINPKIGAGTSHHVITGGPKSKFGIYEDDLLKAIEVAKNNDIHIVGLHQHIGSNIKKGDEEIVLHTMRYTFELLQLFDQVKEINIGGGLGVAYKDSEEISQPSTLFEKVRQIRDQISKKLNNRHIGILSEPGRYIIADSSVLLCKVTATKKTPEKVFIGTDTGFNHLIRPALYGSHHDIINLTNPAPSRELATICGNICQCTDSLGVDIELSAEIGDILAIENVGAYGFSMSSNYNQRLKPAEVMINIKDEIILIRRRETYEDLIDRI